MGWSLLKCEVVLVSSMEVPFRPGSGALVLARNICASLVADVTIDMA